MTDLTRLKVSLTKHGAHKLARLLRHFPAEKVLENTSGAYEDIDIDLSQAKKNLSVFEDGTLPGVWHQAQEAGDRTVDYAVFLAISFSHHHLIDALQGGASGDMRGDIKLDMLPGTKSFTNYKNDLEELGLSTASDSSHVSYSFREMFSDTALPPVAAEIFRLKLSAAGWGGVPELVDECIEQGFHQALAVSEDFFREWLTDATTSESLDDALLDEALDVDEEAEDVTPFEFRPGHTPRRHGKVTRTGGQAASEATLLHNELQTKLYQHLAAQYGEENVATELPSGVSGTLIDAVHTDGDEVTFYEIKTSRTSRACIRQALPQLLEYAYWPDERRAQKLVIVGQCPATKSAILYLSRLRREFGIPVYYGRIDRESGKLEV